MIDLPTMRCSQPVIAPLASRPARSRVEHHRPVEAAGHVVLAGPDEVDRAPCRRSRARWRRPRRSSRRSGVARRPKEPPAHCVCSRTLSVVTPRIGRDHGLLDGLELAAGIDVVAAVRGPLDRGVERLHRRVREVGEGELGLQHLGRRRRSRRRGVALLGGDEARRARARSRYSARIASEERVSAALSSQATLSASRPFMADQVSRGDHRDAGGDRHHVEHARAPRGRRLVVEALHGAAEARRMGDHRGELARAADVEGVDRRAVGLGHGIEARRPSVPISVPLARVLEARLLRHRLGRGGLGEFAEPGLPVRGGVADDARFAR